MSSLEHRLVWNSYFVRNRLQSSGVSERASFCYFLAIMAFDWLQFTIIAITPRPEISQWSSAGSWLTFGITIFGLIYLFSKNGGRSGKQFLYRYFPLSVTVGWKFLVVSFVSILLIHVLLPGQARYSIGWLITGLVSIINIAMFWRIGFHLAIIAARKEA